MESTLVIPSITGVDVELQVAGPGARSYAFVIDWHIRVLVALAWLVGATFALSGAASLAPAVDAGPLMLFIAFGPPVIIYVLYHPVLEVLMRGQTPGKRIAGVRLVAAANGGIPSVGALLIRNVFRLIDSLPSFYVVGLITTLVTKHAVRIGDIAAGTVLVYDHTQSQRVLDELGSGAVQRLGLENAQVVRELLSRWRELAPESRARLARQLFAKLQIDAGASTDAELEQKLRELLA